MSKFQQKNIKQLGEEIYRAAENGNLILINELLNDTSYPAKELVDYKNIENGNSVLWTTVYNALKSEKPHKEIVKFLLEHPNAKADVNLANNHGLTPLFVACAMGNFEVVAMLIDAGADKEIRCSEKHNAPIHSACFFSSYGDNFDDIKYFKRMITGDMKLSVIQMAKRYLGILQNTPMDSKYFPNLKSDFEKLKNSNENFENETMEIAVSYNHFAVVSKLVNEGAVMNSCNVDGNTALHFAALRGHLPITKLLIDNGMDINQKNSKGFTPLKLAAQANRTAVVMYLIDCGANTEGCSQEVENILVDNEWFENLDNIEFEAN